MSSYLAIRDVPSTVYRMPDPSHPRDAQSGESEHSGPAHSPERIRSTALPPVRAAAFWSAVALPFIYVPLLLVGIETQTEAAAFLLLVVAHVVALVIGRSYAPE